VHNHLQTITVCECAPTSSYTNMLLLLIVFRDEGINNRLFSSFGVL
jgi:hypothetical protein